MVVGIYAIQGYSLRVRKIACRMALYILYGRLPAGEDATKGAVDVRSCDVDVDIHIVHN